MLAELLVLLVAEPRVDDASCATPRTISGRIASVMRLRSSGGAFAAQSVSGTTPNIEPPSRPEEAVVERDQLQVAQG